MSTLDVNILTDSVFKSFVFGIIIFCQFYRFGAIILSNKFGLIIKLKFGLLKNGNIGKIRLG